MSPAGDFPPPPQGGSWTHSFEEDAEGVEVYRPTGTYAFPPSRRGRKRLTFTDAEVIESEPGPDDRPRPRAALPARAPGRFGNGEEGVGGFEIVEATSDVLRVRRT